MAFFVIIIALGCALMLSGSEASCTDKDQDKCDLMVRSYSRNQVAQYFENRRQLDIFCSNFQLYEFCVMDLSNCSLDVAHAVEGIVNSFAYVCHVGFEMMLEYSPCFRDMTHNDSIADCPEKTSSCRDARAHLACRRDRVEQHCGTDAASYAHNFTMFLYKPQYTDCDLECKDCDLLPSGGGSGAETVTSAGLVFVTMLYLTTLFNLNH